MLSFQVIDTPIRFALSLHNNKLLYQSAKVHSGILVLYSSIRVQVYDQAADTEIPTLQKFVQSLSEEPRRRQTQLLLQSLQQLLIEIKSHLSDSGTEVRIRIQCNEVFKPGTLTF